MYVPAITGALYNNAADWAEGQVFTFSKDCTGKEHSMTEFPCRPQSRLHLLPGPVQKRSVEPPF